MKKTKIKNKKKYLILAAIVVVMAVLALVIHPGRSYSFDPASVPEYSGTPYYVLNDNKPVFDPADYPAGPFVIFSELDSLERCGPAFARLSADMMPGEYRQPIYTVTPSGWNNEKYDFIDQEYLYNRCHLIAFMLTGENANEKNLITGTRYMNVEGMLPFETRVARYLQLSGNHVLYRVTPVFKDNNLVASGVQMEAYSVEDNGKNICFNVYVYNVQPGVKIDYKTGESEPEK